MRTLRQRNRPSISDLGAPLVTADHRRQIAAATDAQLDDLIDRCVANAGRGHALAAALMPIALAEWERRAAAAAVDPRPLTDAGAPHER